MRVKALLLLLLFATTAYGQNNFVYPLPDPSRVSVSRDVEFGNASTPLLLDFYRPANELVVPVVVFANVGSRAYRSWGVYQGWARAVAGEGMAAFVYDATQQAAVSDFDALIATLRSRAAEWRIDPSRIVVWAASANVTVGLPIVMDTKREYIRGAVLYYGDGDAAEIRTDLPVLFIRAGLDNPDLNARIDRLTARAIAANAHWTIENYGGGVHAFDVLDDNEVSREMIRRTIAFMKSAVRDDLHRAYEAAASDAALGGAFARGDWQKAIEGYRQRVAAKPEDGELHRKLGLSLLGNEQNEEALAELTRAWELGRRGTRDTVYPAARAAARSGNVERAIHWTDLVLSSAFGPPIEELRTSSDFAKVRDHAEFQRLIAEVEKERAVVAAFEEERSREALLELKGAKSGRLARENVLNSIGYRLLQRGRSNDAVAVFELATKRYPRSANAWDSLSEAAEAAGAKRDAARYASRALKLVENDPSLPAETRENVRRAAANRMERLKSE